MKKISLLLATMTLIGVCGCGGSNSDSTHSSPNDDRHNIAINDLSEVSIDISGNATYDNVPHTKINGLDYTNTGQDPIEGATVEALINGQVIAKTSTDASGNYQFTDVPTRGQKIMIRVRAELIKKVASDGDPSWDMRVVDNTQGQATYALDSVLTPTESSDLVVDLHAGSGWGGSAYTAIRAAAPFHILARANDMIQKLVAVDADIQMPALIINWSVNNVGISGDLTVGKIGTSFYNGELYFLGKENSDTDEYDGHVIIHELGHYFENKLSRADSIGGHHDGQDSLDMRVAFSEGFGNAWSGMITDDPVYRDSVGPQQRVGFSTDVENNPTKNRGWFNEFTVQSVLYDIYDSTNEAGDTVSLGFGPIYNAFVGAQKKTPAFTSIFSFISNVKFENSSDASGIDKIVVKQKIVGSTMDIYGSTEINDAGNVQSLPVYLKLTANGVASSKICSINDFDKNKNKNRLAIFRYVRFTITVAGSYTLTAVPVGDNAETADIDFGIYQKGVLLELQNTGSRGVEVNTRNYAVGDYVASIYEFGNRFNVTKASQDSCFTVSLTDNKE